MNFFSSYYNENNKLVFDIQNIALNYVKGWFFVDLIAFMPFEMIIGDFDTNQTYNKLFRLLRLPRLYSLTRIIKL